MKIISKIKESYSKSGLAAKRLFWVEVFFAALFITAIIRLAIMQCITHADYKRYFSERFHAIYGEDSGKDNDFNPLSWEGTRITDRNGRTIAADDFRANVVISTEAMKALSYQQEKNCSDLSNGTKMFEKTGFGKRTYHPDCEGERNRNLQRRKSFADRLMTVNIASERNGTVFYSTSVFNQDRSLSRRDGSTAYMNLDINEYQTIQEYLADIRYVRDQINGFKFEFVKGTLDTICLTADSEDLKKSDIKVKDIRIPKNEKKMMSDSEKEKLNSNKDRTIYEYCQSDKPENKVRIGIIPSEIFESNSLTPQIISEIEKELSSEELEKIHASGNKFDLNILWGYIVGDPSSSANVDSSILRQINDKKMICNGKSGADYNSIFCRKLYSYNLSKIASFFKKNKEFFENTDEILSELEKYKDIFPNSKIAIPIPKEKLKDIKKDIAPLHWNFREFAEYMIFSLKNISRKQNKSEYRRKVSISENNGNPVLYVNKKQIRNIGALSGKKKNLRGSAKSKEQDKIYHDFATRLDKILRDNNIPENHLVDANEKDYKELARIEKDKFDALLPEISVFGGSYFMDGLEFEQDRHYRSVLAGTADYENIPVAASVKQHDYVLSQLLGIGENATGGIENCYLEKRQGKTVLGSKITDTIPGLKKYSDKEIASVRLTIDMELQNLAELLLKRQAEKNVMPERGFAIVQDVHTGGILAAASYNPDWRSGLSIEMLNFIYQPGSTMKPITIASALDLGLPEISNNSLYDLKSNYKSAQESPDKSISKSWKLIRDDHDIYSGLYSLKDIIAASSNVGTAWVAHLLWDKPVSDRHGNSWNSGQEYMKAMRAKFGFGERTGMGASICSAENCGNNAPTDTGKKIPKDKQGSCGAYAVDDINRIDYLKDSYGQGPVDATPLQIISAYSALANGGTLYKPYIVSSIEYADGSITGFDPVAVRKDIISKETAALAREYMKAVFESKIPGHLEKPVEGTGRGYAISGMEIGGKTGTADKYACPIGKICFPYQCEGIKSEEIKSYSYNCPEDMQEQECEAKKEKLRHNSVVALCKTAYSCRDGVCPASKCDTLLSENEKNACKLTNRQVSCPKGSKCPKGCDALEGQEKQQCADFYAVISEIREKFIDSRQNITVNFNGSMIKPNRASFVAFLPYQDPKYVIYVMYDESELTAREKGIHPQGARAAGPVLKTIAEYLRDKILAEKAAEAGKRSETGR